LPLYCEFSLPFPTVIYMGRDINGNYYWSDNAGVIVFDKNGWMLDLFVVDPNKIPKPAPPSTPPATSTS
ncbi:MAG: hypothetical protein JW822_08375, partial [Spirochaetales bacterium]|nr:hypothetical protein [Spirochaetales bacterium]